MRFTFKEVYAVNEKKGEVTCKLFMKNYSQVVWTVEALRIIERDNCPMYIKQPLPARLVVPESFVGRAKLANGDTWDTSVGRKIAREKAYDKFQEWSKKYFNYLKMTTGCISTLSKSQNK